MTIDDSVKAASNNLLRVGLANYTQTLNPNVTRDYFNRWIRDVRSAYPAFGVDVGYALANGVHSAYGVSINYNLGLARSWSQPTSYSASNATVSTDVASVGLMGYNFSSQIFLKMSILVAKYDTTNKYVAVYLTVEKEDLVSVVSLQANNFPSVKLDNVAQSSSVKRYYSSTYNCFIYEIRVNSVAAKPSNVEVTLIDSRSIKTVSYTTTIA